MPLSYADAIAYLYPRLTQIKFGLETTRALLAPLGDPHLVVPAVHVGGTNGKGSGTTLVPAGPRAAGLSTGPSTAPLVVSFRELIFVDGIPIGGNALAMWPERLRPPADEL